MWNNLDGLAANNSGILSFQIQKRRDSAPAINSGFLLRYTHGDLVDSFNNIQGVTLDHLPAKVYRLFSIKKYFFVYHSETVDDSERVLVRVITIYYDDNF